MRDILIYGANGYSGRMIAERLVERGVKPIVAGRNDKAITALGQELGVPSRAFGLDDPQAVSIGLENVSVVVHCAGPYATTFKPMLDSCIQNKVHYLDITGQYQVIEAIAARHEELKTAGIMAMCSIGFDVVPSDCILAHVAARLPTATHLEVYVRPSRGATPGTASSLVERLGLPNAVRQKGQLVERCAGADRRSIEFPDGQVKFVGIPWGDISTGWKTTHIPNIATFLSFGPAAPIGMYLSGYLRPLLQSKFMQARFKSLIKRYVKGPGEEWHQSAHSEVIAEVRDDQGNICRSYVRTPEAYFLTAVTACEIASRVHNGDTRPGFQTPAGLFGPDFILQFDGVERKDLI
jgi:short subunit dehydrogenase-like uncharacterized protein